MEAIFIRIQQLYYIIKIVEVGSINEAAKQLFITQPSLSNAVKELEKEMNITIFNRNPRGITLSTEGAEFLSYARQVVEQAELLEQRYKGKQKSRQLFAISAQHYAFVVNAFVHLLKEIDRDEYEMTLRETRTYEIIEDVTNFRSELGVLYMNDFNRQVITKLLRENNLEFHHLFEAKPHVFLSVNNPLAKKKRIYLEDLKDFPYLSYEQGEYNSFYFSEEILSTLFHKKSIVVSDRATLFNLLIGLDGYTISSGILNSDLNGEEIIALPLEVDETIELGYIQHKKNNLSPIATKFLEELLEIIKEYGFNT
jgi:DNA-binding transcriptional LysR family regulator